MLTRSAFDGSKHVDNVLDHGKLVPKSCKKRRSSLLFLKGKGAMKLKALPGKAPCVQNQLDEDVSDWVTWILTEDAQKPPPQRETPAERRRRLVHLATERHQQGRFVRDAMTSENMDFAECCVMSVAIWLRFGNADFAEQLGWIPRSDYAAMNALPANAVEAAVALWKKGMHATGTRTARQRSVRQSELRAWKLGAGEAESTENIRTLTPLARIKVRQSRASRVNQPGELLVRHAYERLILGQEHSLWDLWRKRGFVIQAALEGGGFRPLREALRKVRGYCGPDMDNDYEAWALAVDLVAWSEKSFCWRFMLF